MRQDHEFLLVFEYIDQSVFKTISNLKHRLDIQCKGRYQLHVGFNNKENGFSRLHNLLGAPALINLKTQQVVYGDFRRKESLNHAL